MKAIDIFLTANSNLLRSKLRTLLTVLAIIVGAFTLTITNGIGAGISTYVNKQVNSLGQKDALTITAKSSSSRSDDKPAKFEPGQSTLSGGGRRQETAIAITPTDLTKLRGVSDLTDVQPVYSLNLDYIQGQNPDHYMVTASSITDSAHLDVSAGGQLTAGSSEHQVVLPASYVSSLGYANDAGAIGTSVAIAVTDSLGKSHLFTAKVMGVQRKGLSGSAGVAMTNSLRTALYDAQSTGLSDIAKSKYAAATARIQGDLSSAHVDRVKAALSTLGYSGETIGDRLGTFQTVITAITWVLRGFASIALLAAGFGIVNTLLMSVQERTKEIGLMKAMGMARSRIFLLFSCEAVLIGLWGSLVGMLGAIGIGSLIDSIVAHGFLKNLPGFENARLVWPHRARLKWPHLRVC